MKCIRLSSVRTHACLDMSWLQILAMRTVVVPLNGEIRSLGCAAAHQHSSIIAKSPEARTNVLMSTKMRKGTQASDSWTRDPAETRLEGWARKGKREKEMVTFYRARMTSKVGRLRSKNINTLGLSTTAHPVLCCSVGRKSMVMREAPCAYRTATEVMYLPPFTENAENGTVSESESFGRRGATRTS